MRYDLCNFAYLCKRGKMGCFERQILAVCWWLTAHFCNNMSKNAFCFWAGVVLHRPSTLPFFLKEFLWLSHSFFHCWPLVFDFDRRTKEHIFYFGRWPLAVSRLEDGELNSRGFSNPWTTSRFYNSPSVKTGDFNTVGLLSPRPRCRFASLQTPFLLLFCFHGLKSPRLFAFGFASFRRLVLYVMFDGWADLISALCLMFNFWFVFRCFANG